MKKLLVLALSVVMVLSFAAVSMAAVTVGGEVNFGFHLAGPETAPGVDFVASDFGDAKVTATAALNDEVTAFVAVKGASDTWAANIDETWVKFTEGFGTVQVGYYGWNIKDKIDILNPVGEDLKSDAGISVNITAAEGVTVGAFVGRPDDKMDMGFKVAYATDAFGASVGYKKWDDTRVDGSKLAGTTSKDGVMGLNAWYNLSPAVIYLVYGSQGSDYSDAVLGASYDSDSFYARAEFEVVKPDAKKDSDSAFRLGYKLGNGASIQLDSKTINGADAVTDLKLNVVF